MKIQRRRSRAGIPSMAMGDIAFNLLIFFVILARAHDDSHLQWTPAQAKDLQSARAAKVSVLVDKDDLLYLNGREVGLSQLTTAIQSQLGNAPAGERTVLLKIHGDTTALRFEPILEAIGEAGGDLVHVLEEDRN